MINANNVVINGPYVEKNEASIINNINGQNICDNQVAYNELNMSYITQLNDVLNTLQIECNTREAKEYIKDIRQEFNSEKPNVGRIRAAFNMLKRVCTSKKFLEAAQVFGDLLIKALK